MKYKDKKKVEDLKIGDIVFYVSAFGLGEKEIQQLSGKTAVIDRDKIPKRPKSVVRDYYFNDRLCTRYFLNQEDAVIRLLRKTANNIKKKEKALLISSDKYSEAKSFHMMAEVLLDNIRINNGEKEARPGTENK